MRANCFEREHLFAYAGKMLEARDEIEVRAHLAECAACRKVVEGYRQLDELLDLWQPTAPSPWFDARVRAAVAAGELRSASFWGRLLAGLGWRRWLAPALVVIMVVASAVIVQRRPGLLSRSGAHVGGASQASRANVPSQVGTPEEGEEGTTRASTVDDYDMLANFDVLSELPKPGGKVVD
jgi:anti-sigma factor RsiW